MENRWFRRAVRACIVLLLCVLGAVPARASDSATRHESAHVVRQISVLGQESSAAGPIVVVGFSGVTWSDATEETAPNLYAFGANGASANVVVRTVHETTCPFEGWLTIGAGQRAVDEGCRVHPRESWDALLAQNESSSYGARLGILGDSLDSGSVLAMGAGAQLALRNHSGEQVGQAVDLAPLPAVPSGASDAQTISITEPDAAQAARAYAENASGKRLVAVDLGAVRDPDSPLSDSDTSRASGAFEKLRSSFRAAGPSSSAMRAQVSLVDARFGALLESIRSTTPNATILALSVGDSQRTTPDLGYFAAQGNRVAGIVGTADSSGTRQAGLVQLTDVLPTILSWMSTESIGSTESTESTESTKEDAFTGAVISFSSEDSAPSRLVDDQLRSRAVRPFIGPFYLLLAAGMLAVVLMLVTGYGKKNPRFVRQTAVMVSALPVASLLVNLLPWWRSGAVGGNLAMGILAIATVVAAWGLWKSEANASHPMNPYRPMVRIGSFTALVLIADVLLNPLLRSYPLQLGSLLGTQPQVGGRFYGFSNATFAMFAAGLVVALAAATRSMGRKKACAMIGGIGILAVIIDGMPTLGADFGGPPVLVVAIAVLMLLRAGRRMTLLRMVGIVAIALSVSMIFAWMDYLKPPIRRSHLGRFIESLIDGRAWEIVSRKISLVFFDLPPMAIGALVLCGVLLIAVGVRRGWFSPLGRLYSPGGSPSAIGAAALLTALVLGMVINDSGVVVPFIGLVVAVPLWCIARVSNSQVSNSPAEKSPQTA